MGVNHEFNQPHQEHSQFKLKEADGMKEGCWTSQILQERTMSYFDATCTILQEKGQMEKWPIWQSRNTLNSPPPRDTPKL